MEASPDKEFLPRLPTAPVEKEQQPSPRLGELMVMDETPHFLHLSWTVAKGPLDYFVVQYWDTNGQPQAFLVGGNQSNVFVSGLEPSTPYKFFLYGLWEGRRLGLVSTQGTIGTTQQGPCIFASPASSLGLGGVKGAASIGEYREGT